MAIQDFMKTPFTLEKLSEVKDAGRLKKVFTLDAGSYLCAIFTPVTDRIIQFGKRDYTIQKNLYCEVEVDIARGDRINVDGLVFDVGQVVNSNHMNHHLLVNLIRASS